ncbi:MAG: 1-acyl-sn-glycerol-3-phosphate acyltransferase [SAR324 cluster bacterium]|nr:1-acyl-sn-glycerol-3-phosphate acyltransferase [SAR324 cluster bacterium]
MSFFKQWLSKKPFRRFKFWEPKDFSVFGATHQSRRKLIRELEKSTLVQEALNEHPPKKPWYRPFYSPVRDFYKEMIAVPSVFAVFLASIALRFLWNRIFDGVVVKGLDEQRQSHEGKTIIYIPCHRSHLDYGLLSHILYEHKLSLPMIIAGENLNMFIVGAILKRGGAVFIRRVFKGQKLYSTVFLSYLYYLLDNKFSMEFFIEGTRSRTGKNLPPKTGFLSMLVQYVEEKPDRDLHLVPVSNVYDRVMEESSYVKELGGLPKRKESLGGLLRSRKMLSVNYGKVYVSFSPPISLRGLMQRYYGQADRGAMLYRLGMDITDTMNKYSVTSATPLIATILLSEKKQGFRKEELIEKGKFLIDLYEVTHPRPKETLLGSKETLEEVIQFMFRSGSVGMLEDPKGDIYYFRYQNKIRLNIYKNIIIHHLVIPSVLAFQLQKEPQTKESLLGHILIFDHLFRYEFMFPSSFDFIDNVTMMLNFFEKYGLTTKNGEIYTPNPDKFSEMQILARILLPFREAFRIAIYYLTQVRDPASSISSKEIIGEMQRAFLKLYLLAEVEAPEANLTVTYDNIIRYLTEENYLKKYYIEEMRKSIILPGEKFDQLNDIEEKLI